MASSTYTKKLCDELLIPFRKTIDETILKIKMGKPIKSEDILSFNCLLKMIKNFEKIKNHQGDINFKLLKSSKKIKSENEKIFDQHREFIDNESYQDNDGNYRLNFNSSNETDFSDFLSTNNKTQYNSNTSYYSLTPEKVGLAPINDKDYEKERDEIDKLNLANFYLSSNSFWFKTKEENEEDIYNFPSIPENNIVVN